MKNHRGVNAPWYLGLGLVSANLVILPIQIFTDGFFWSNLALFIIGVIAMIWGWFTRHNWSEWSAPHERTCQTYDAPPALVLNQELKTYRAEIQDRKCTDCGKYQWRKV